MEDKFKKLFKFIRLVGQLIMELKQLTIKLISIVGWIAILIYAIKGILSL